MRWPDLERSIGKAFQELREGKELFDVTLACKDGKLEAHKVILSSCSPVLKDIIKDNVPLIYINDVKIPQLRAVLDFMYQGQVNVVHENLNSFLALAERLQVRGLTSNIASNNHPRTTATTSVHSMIIYFSLCFAQQDVFHS